MRARLLLALAAVALALAIVPRGSAIAANTASHGHRTPTPAPPVIYHGVVRPLCTALARHIKTVVGMMIENDHTISQSPPLFSQYNRDLDQVDQSGNATNPAARDLTLYHLEQLVGPLANNVNAMQRELENPAIFPSNPQTEDEKELDAMRDQLLKALATQAVSLDIINGYVQTQQLAEMQQQGLTGSELHAINGTEMTYSPSPATPLPGEQDPNQAGLPQNPYAMDPLAVPGMTGSVGTTPATRILEALRWLQQETARRENIASQSIVSAAHSCSAHPSAAPPRP